VFDVIEELIKTGNPVEIEIVTQRRKKEKWKRGEGRYISGTS